MRDLMRWNIKLSDLETINSAIIWLAVVALFLFAIVDMIQNNAGPIEYGAVLSVIMYVFQYSDDLFAVPENYQQWLRLKEISSRLLDP